MNNKENIYSISKVNFYLSVLLAFMIPINRIVSTYIMVLWAVTWIIERIRKVPCQKLNKNQYYILISIIIFYILHVVGLINTTNIENGFIDLRINLPLLVFPLFFIFHNRNYNKFYHFILLAFISGTILTLLFLYVRAIYFYPILHKDAFYYTQISYMFHPSYLSMYVIFSVIALIYLYENNLKKFLLPLIFILLFLIASIYFLASKTNFLSFLIIFFIYTLIKLFKKYKIIFLSIFILVITGSYFAIKSNYHLNTLFQLNSNTFQNLDKTSKASNIVRIYIIKSGLQLIKENPFGYGTGDVKDELMRKYSDNGYTGALEEKLNAHNQYLETTIGLGIQGTIILLFILFFPLAIAIKSRNYLLYLFILLVIINFLSESMLNRQDGVVFITFFLTLLISIQHSKAVKIKQTISKAG